MLLSDTVQVYNKKQHLHNRDSNRDLRQLAVVYWTNTSLAESASSAANGDRINRKSV